MSLKRDCLRFTILGCGSSVGTPRITGDWGLCDPTNPKNRRTRSSALVQRINAQGKKTSVVIDTGPDFREQMLREKVENIDAVVYTHPHADHLHGIDDLRSYFFKNKKCVDIYANARTLSYIEKTFSYYFKDVLENFSSPIFSSHLIQEYEPFMIEGEGGNIEFYPFLQQHGKIRSLGFRFGSIAYCSDVNNFPPKTIPVLNDLEYLIIDGLEYEKHSSHFSVKESLEWIKKLQSRHAILTHMHYTLDYNKLSDELPKNVQPAYDGLFFEIMV